MLSPERLYGLLLTAVPIVLSLSLHELAHARTALAFGDPTAKALGRCTLNPLAHLDPLGTLMLVFVGFGWARPVPVNPANLHPPRLGNVAVSLAGPASNLGVAVLSPAVLRILAAAGFGIKAGGAFSVAEMGVLLLTYTMLINLTLCIFNLIPLYPLDGHHIGEALGGPGRERYMRWQVHFGRWVLLALLVGPVLLETFTGVEGLDPLGWYLGHALVPLVGAMTGPDALHLAVGALHKFAGFTPFA